MGGRGSNGYWDGKPRREKEQRIENLEAEFWGPELETKPKKSKREAGIKSKDKNKWLYRSSTRRSSSNWTFERKCGVSQYEGSLQGW